MTCFEPSTRFIPSEFSSGEGENYGIIPLVVAGVVGAVSIGSSIVGAISDNKRAKERREQQEKQAKKGAKTEKETLAQQQIMLALQVERAQAEAAMEAHRAAVESKSMQTKAVAAGGAFLVLGLLGLMVLTEPRAKVSV